jgi:hypothetical protein
LVDPDELVVGVVGDVGWIEDQDQVVFSFPAFVSVDLVVEFVGTAVVELLLVVLQEMTVNKRYLVYI